MKRILYILALIALTTWVIGTFFFAAGMFIHLLIILAMLFWMQAVIINPKPQASRRTV